jgi:hypothetical protein
MSIESIIPSNPSGGGTSNACGRVTFVSLLVRVAMMRRKKEHGLIEYSMLVAEKQMGHLTPSKAIMVI